MAKLNKILESIENLKLTTEVALLENTEVTDLVRAQSKLMINESINFIKTELTKGGILEDVQLMLKNAWTQTLLEDISPDMVDNGMRALANTPTSPLGAAYVQGLNQVQAANDSLMNDLQAKHAGEIANLQKIISGAGARAGIAADNAYADGVSKAHDLAGQAKAAYDALPGQAQAAYDSAKAGIQALPGQAQAAYDSTKAAVQALPGQAKAAYDALPGQAQAAYDSAKASAQEIPGKIAQVGRDTGAAIQGAYDGSKAGLGAKINADGSPLSNTQMAGFGAGSAALAAGAGYGAHRLAQKVKRSNTFR